MKSIAMTVFGPVFGEIVWFYDLIWCFSILLSSFDYPDLPVAFQIGGNPSRFNPRVPPASRLGQLAEKAREPYVFIFSASHHNPLQDENPWLAVKNEDVFFVVSYDVWNGSPMESHAKWSGNGGI